MDALLHRLEALPGDGRFAVTFRRPDGTEQTAVVQLRDPGPTPSVQVDPAGVDVAEASLPPGWARDSEAFAALVEALRAMARSRSLSAPASGELRDPDGGWDVSLGNVVLGATGVPSCIAHGELLGDGAGRWVCPDCGAQALYGPG